MYGVTFCDLCVRQGGLGLDRLGLVGQYLLLAQGDLLPACQRIGEVRLCLSALLQVISDVGLLDADLGKVGAGQVQPGARDFDLLSDRIGVALCGVELGERLLDVGPRRRDLALRLGGLLPRRLQL